MFKFLAGLEFWQVAILFIVTFGSILLVIFRGKISFLSGDKRIEINKEEAKMGENRHGDCPFVYDILGVINKTAEISSRIVSIRDNLLKDQMKYTNQKLLIISDVMKQEFIGGLINAGVEEPTRIDGYDSYSILLDLLEYKLSTFFQNAFVDNHFNRFQNSDGSIDFQKFNKYTDEKINAIESIINEIFNNHYKKVSSINREDLRKINGKIGNDLNQMFTEILANGLEIASSGNKKIISLDRELKQHIKKIIGVEFKENANETA